MKRLLIGLILTLALLVNVSLGADLSKVKVGLTQQSWTGETDEGGAHWLFYWFAELKNSNHDPNDTAKFVVIVSLFDRNQERLAYTISPTYKLPPRHHMDRDGYVWIPADIRWKTAEVRFDIMSLPQAALWDALNR